MQGGSVSTGDLPTFAAKGERQKLDRDWTKLLHREGLSPFLPEGSEPPAKLGRAIREFNEAQYWRCHETLEELWLPEDYPQRLFYHGLIKAAVGLLHLERHNCPGGTAKLRDAQYALTPFAPRFMGVEIGNLLSDLSKRLFYCQDAAVADWNAIDQLSPVYLHFERSY